MAKRSASRKIQKLHKELHQLQANGTVVWANFRKSNKDFYRHIAEVYFWWIQALQVPGLLDAEYEKIKRRHRELKHGYNYTRLLVLVWGNDNCNDADLARHSRALNEVNKEYFSREAYYAKDGVAKIAQFIEQNGGIHGLTGYGKEDAGATEDESRIDLTPPRATDKEKFDALVKSAKTHYAQSAAPIHTFNTSLPVTDDDLAVVLVRRTAAGYQLLGATNDKDAVEAAAVVNYKHTFSALPPSIRSLIETLRTQCLPPHILKIQRDLVDKSKQKHSDGTKMLNMRRLLYRHDHADFLLSPVRAHTGVVTIAKPKSGGLEQVDGDVFLSSRARLALERLAISNYEFNLYKAEAEDQIKQYEPEDSASHVLRLQSIANEADYLHLDFWQYDDQLNPPLPQVDIDLFGKADWKTDVTLSWFRELSNNIVSKWFASHAKHIKRDHQKICRLDFNRDAIEINFVRRDGTFEHRHHIPLAKQVSGFVTLSLLFRTKDLMPVLASIADLEVDGDIEISVTSDVVHFVFETNATKFSVAVPTANDKEILSTKSFTSYLPTATLSDALEAADEEFDYEAEAALWDKGAS